MVCLPRSPTRPMLACMVCRGWAARTRSWRSAASYKLAEVGDSRKENALHGLLEPAVPRSRSWRSARLARRAVGTGGLAGRIEFRCQKLPNPLEGETTGAPTSRSFLALRRRALRVNRRGSAVSEPFSGGRKSVAVPTAGPTRARSSHFAGPTSGTSGSDPGRR